MIHRSGFLIIYLFLISNLTYTQRSFPANYFRSPLDIDLYLSANFGELRTDHFHSGIDIKTQGVTGQKIYAVADAWVSRIKIESGGYGRTLYLSHPEGYVSVYAHLDRFTADIADYVKEIQYKNEQHALNIFPEKGQFHFKKGELIAYTGNSGYSMGPHLHFEIRDARNQNPLNVLLFKFDIEDLVPPSLFKLYIYPMDARSFANNSHIKSSIGLRKGNGSYSLVTGDSIFAFGRIGFGLEAFDYLNGSRNRCGIYSVEMQVDGSVACQWVMDEFSFAESRYINSLIDYEEAVLNNTLVQKTFIEPNNRLGLYRTSENQGILDIEDGSHRDISFVLKDAYGNQTSLAFHLAGSDKAPDFKDTAATEKTQLLRWDMENSYEAEGISLKFPAGALYSDLNFACKISGSHPLACSEVFQIHNKTVPVHQKVHLSMDAGRVPAGLEDKALIAAVNGDNLLVSAGGTWEKGSVKTDIQSFGEYLIAIDSTAPDIRPVNLTVERDMTGLRSLKFTVTDELSGIKSYDGYIDSKWALFEYDAKNDLVFYLFDPDRIEQGSNHELELFIVDNKDNVSYYYTEFTW